MTAFPRHGRVRSGAAVVVVALLGLGGCSAGDGGSASGDSSTTSTTSGNRFEASGDCPMLPPGQLMSAAEATIRFSIDRICPGYVTIAPGTTVQVRNESTKSARFQVHEGADGTGAQVFDQRLAAGGEASITFERPGIHIYTTSLIPSFHGTIEVVEG